MGYTGQVNVSAEVTGPLRQKLYDPGNPGCRMVFRWGGDVSAFRAGASSYEVEATPSLYESAEWALFNSVYSEYRILGMKIEVTPAAHVGQSADARALGSMHVGSSIEQVVDPNELTTQRVQVAADYQRYRATAQTGGFKRYYKVAARQRRRFEQQWISTDDTDYSNAQTYVNWPGYGITDQNLTNGVYTVRWYLQFRNPKLTSIPLP